MFGLTSSCIFQAIVPRVQEMILGGAAPLLLPSAALTRGGVTTAKAIVSASQSPAGVELPLSFAKVGFGLVAPEHRAVSLLLALL